MYKSALMLFCILTASVCFSQGDTTWYDASWQKTTKDKAAFFRPKPVKIKEGYLIADHYADGRVQMQGISSVADKGLWNGWVSWHYENGTIKQRALYTNHLMDSMITYHKNGMKESVQPYKNGNIEGTALLYDSSGQLSQSVEFIKGRIHGKREYYYEGKVLLSENYRSGKLEGDRITYSTKGIVIAKEQFAEGKREGISEEFYSTGIIKSRTHFIHDYRNGLAEDFDEQGHLVKSAYYTKYDLNGPVTAYYPTGAVRYKASYVNDLPDSSFTTYDSTGSLQLQAQFSRGILNGKYLSLNNGRPVIEASFKQGSLQYWTSYYSNGNIFRACVVNADSLTEQWVTYNEDGTKLLETTYRFNSPAGTWRLFDKNGLVLEVDHRSYHTAEALEIRRRNLLHDKKEQEKINKEADEDYESDEDSLTITADELTATTTRLEDAEQLNSHLPAHYFFAEKEMLDKESAFDEFGNQHINLYYGNGAIVFMRDTEDSAISVVCHYSPDGFTKPINETTFRYFTHADGLQLILDHEQYKPKPNEVAMFAEPPSEIVQKVIRISAGNKLRKKIMKQPLLAAAIAHQLYQNSNGAFSLAEITLCLCREIFDK